jgi:hypothetical protein
VGEEIAEEIKDEVQVCNLGHELVTLLWLWPKYLPERAI